MVAGVNLGATWLDRFFVVSIIVSSIVTYALPYRRSMVRNSDGSFNSDGRTWVGLICVMPFVWVGLLWAQKNSYLPVDLSFVGVPVLTGYSGGN